jgi:hypothetical protein
MKKHHEQLLIAALAGLVIVSGALFAIQPATASVKSQQTSVIDFDALNLRVQPSPTTETVALDTPAPCFINAASCPFERQGAAEDI